MSTKVNISDFSWLNPYYSLQQEIEQLHDKENLQPADIALLRNGFEVWPLQLFPGMKAALRKLPTVHIQRLIKKVLEEGHVNEALACLSFLNSKDLRTIAGFTDEQAQEAAYANDLLGKERALENWRSREWLTLYNEGVETIKDVVHHVLSLFVAISGFHELGHAGNTGPHQGGGDNSSQQASMRLDMYVRVLFFPSVVFAACRGYTRSKMEAVALTVLTVSASALFVLVYSRYFTPCPKVFYGMTNLTQKSLRLTEAPVYPREDILRKIRNALLQDHNVLLVSKCGVGKTKIVQAFADQMVAGKMEGFSRATQLFAINAGSLGSLRSWVSSESIEAGFSRHRNQVLFFFDEFHSLFQSKQSGIEGSLPANAIKTFDFRLIAATTEEEYKKHLEKQTAILGRRFLVIPVEEPSDEVLTSMLYTRLHHHDPYLEVSLRMIPYIIQRAREFNPGTSRVDAALSLLKLAISRGQDLSHQAEFRKLESDARIMDVVQLRCLHYKDAPQELQNLYKQVNESLQPLQERVEVSKKALKNIQQLEGVCRSLKQRRYQWIRTGDVSPADKKMWLKMRAVMRVLSRLIAHKRTEIGLPSHLGRELINQLVNSEVSARRRSGSSTPAKRLLRNSAQSAPSKLSASANLDESNYLSSSEEERDL